MSRQASASETGGERGKVMVIPAVLPLRWEDVARAARALAGVAPRVQIDIVDGVCGKETTWPFVHPDHWEDIVSEKEGLPAWEDIDYEIDLMVSAARLRAMARDWTRAGASAIIFHPWCAKADREALLATMDEAREMGVEIGVAVRPAEDIASYGEFFARAAFVQLMGNNEVGAHGLPLLLEEVCAKAQEVRGVFQGPLGIDIGVKETTLPRLAACGFTRFAVGSAIVKADNPKEAYQRLVALAQRHATEAGDSSLRES